MIFLRQAYVGFGVVSSTWNPGRCKKYFPSLENCPDLLWCPTNLLPGIFPCMLSARCRKVTIHAHVIVNV